MTNERRPLTFGSLFAGIGGFDLGFERAGLECKWQVEIDPYSLQVLEEHWPEIWRCRGAHLGITPQMVRDLKEKVDERKAEQRRERTEQRS